METPLVSIACITYNHDDYIRQCLDGFVMQKTSFPVEIIIHDDASTDRTQDIIKEYIQNYPQFKWKPILQKENRYKEGKGILARFVYPECTGKYIALCEGDDYWTDPMKLQKQIDYLVEHPSASLCFTNVVVQSDIDNDNSDLFCHLRDRDYDGDEIIETWTVPTCTVVFSSKVINNIPKDDRFKVGDNVLLLSAASQGDLHCINEKTGVYRRNQSGWSASCKAIEKYQGMVNHCYALIDHFPQYSRGIKSVIVRYYIRIGWRMLRNKNPKAIVYAIKGFLLNPVKFVSHLYKLMTSHKY